MFWKRRIDSVDLLIICGPKPISFLCLFRRLYYPAEILKGIFTQQARPAITHDNRLPGSLQKKYKLISKYSILPRSSAAERMELRFRTARSRARRQRYDCTRLSGMSYKSMTERKLKRTDHVYRFPVGGDVKIKVDDRVPVTITSNLLSPEKKIMPRLNSTHPKGSIFKSEKKEKWRRELSTADNNFR